MDTKLNINALNVSPYLWWKYINKGLYFGNRYSKELFDYNFDDWLQGEFDSERRPFDIETWGGYRTDSTHNSIDDYSKIGKKNSIGILISARNKEELSAVSLPEDGAFVYTYSTTSLHHLCFSFFNLWLIFNSDEYWYKWQSYFNFICLNTDNDKTGVYKYFWFCVLLEIDKQEEFEDVSQYKKFIRLLHDYEKETAYLEKKWIEKRDAGKKVS